MKVPDLGTTRVLPTYGVASQAFGPKCFSRRAASKIGEQERPVRSRWRGALVLRWRLRSTTTPAHPALELLRSLRQIIEAHIRSRRLTMGCTLSTSYTTLSTGHSRLKFAVASDGSGGGTATISNTDLAPSAMPPGPFKYALSFVYADLPTARVALTDSPLVSILCTPRAGTANWTCDIDLDGSDNVILNVTCDAANSEAEVEFLYNGFFADVSDYGALGDGVSDNGVPFLNALTALTESGGTLFVPPGIYIIGNPPMPGDPININVYSNITILGCGAASVIKRTSGNSTGGMLLVFGQENVAIRNIALDLNTDVAYVTGINVNEDGDGNPSSNVVIDSCYFLSSSANPDSPQTELAVLVGHCNGLWVTNNHVDQLQLKVSHDTGGPGYFVVGNHISCPFEWGISFVTSSESEFNQDIIITDNYIKDGSSGGIYNANDSNEVGYGESDRVIVRNNVITNSSTTGINAAIYARPCILSTDYFFENNIIIAANATGGYGICVVAAALPNDQLYELKIRGNLVSNTDSPGIYVNGNIQRVDITRNLLVATRGIQFQPGGTFEDLPAGESIADAIVRENVVDGATGSGLNLDLLEGSTLTGLLVCDNIFKNTNPDGFNNAVGILMQLDEDSALQATFLRNRCYDDRNMLGGTSTQKWGIQEVVADGATIDTAYIGNDLRYNGIVVDGMPEGGPADGIHFGAVIQLNRGFVTESSGAVTFDAETTATVLHGLNVTPNASAIVLAIASSPGATDPRPVWVDSINDTSFQINLTTAISGLRIGWRARALSNFI